MKLLYNTIKQIVRGNIRHKHCNYCSFQVLMNDCTDVTACCSNCNVYYYCRRRATHRLR